MRTRVPSWSRSTSLCKFRVMRRGKLEAFSKILCRWCSSILMLFGFLHYRTLSGDVQDKHIMSHTIQHVAPGICHSFYINLKHRTDRRKSIEYQLRRANMSFTRIEATKGLSHQDVKMCWSGEGNFTCPGKIGVKLSHLHALDAAMESRFEAVAIFEDDFAWLPHTDPEFVNHSIRLVQSKFQDWQVIFLSANIQQQKIVQPKLSTRLNRYTSSKVYFALDAQGAHGYVVRRDAIASIRESFASCDVTARREVAIDQCWKILQRSGRWLVFDPQLGTQAPSYSDIELTDVNYGIGLS